MMHIWVIFQNNEFLIICYASYDFWFISYEGQSHRDLDVKTRVLTTKNYHQEISKFRKIWNPDLSLTFWMLFGARRLSIFAKIRACQNKKFSK